MTNNYENVASTIADAMNAVYENKQVNKKNDISGDFSTDDVSYPTCKAVKNYASPISHSHTGYVGLNEVDNWVSTYLEDIVRSAITPNIKEPSELNNIGTRMNATQHEINIAINSILSDINSTVSSVDVIKIVDDKGIPSQDTMNKLYIVSENNKVNVYYTKERNNFNDGDELESAPIYEWKKLDSDILDEISIEWQDIQNKPTFGIGENDFARGNHTHADYVSETEMESKFVEFGNALAEAINPSSS